MTVTASHLNRKRWQSGTPGDENGAVSENRVHRSKPFKNKERIEVFLNQMS